MWWRRVAIWYAISAAVVALVIVDDVGGDYGDGDVATEAKRRKRKRQSQSRRESKTEMFGQQLGTSVHLNAGRIMDMFRGRGVSRGGASGGWTQRKWSSGGVGGGGEGRTWFHSSWSDDQSIDASPVRLWYTFAGLSISLLRAFVYAKRAVFSPLFQAP